MTVSADQLPSRREAPAKHAIVEFIDAVTDPGALHFQHVGQRPILAAGNTDGDLAMLQWTVIDMAADWANVHSAS